MCNNRPATAMTVSLEGRQISVKGREAWALDNLLARGERGVTPIDNPAPRWSHYIFKLRGRGLVIETIDEKHQGPYSGIHARYVLHSPVTVTDIKRAGE